VTADRLSSLPLTGAVAVLRIRPNRLLAEAITSLASTAVPSGWCSAAAARAGSIASRAARFTMWTLPGSSVRATTVLASTRSPHATRTSPLSGSRRSRLTIAWSVILRPGV